LKIGKTALVRFYHSEYFVCVAEVNIAKVKDKPAKNARLSPDELVALAERMVASKDPQEIARLKKQMERGFYGDAENA
jgi:hypothetical protein